MDEELDQYCHLTLLVPLVWKLQSVIVSQKSLIIVSAHMLLEMIAEVGVCPYITYLQLFVLLPVMDAVAVVYTGHLGDTVDVILPASTMVTAALTYLSHKKMLR